MQEGVRLVIVIPASIATAQGGREGTEGEPQGHTVGSVATDWLFLNKGGERDQGPIGEMCQVQPNKGPSGSPQVTLARSPSRNRCYRKWCILLGIKTQGASPTTLGGGPALGHPDLGPLAS